MDRWMSGEKRWLGIDVMPVRCVGEERRFGLPVPALEAAADEGAWKAP
jgi:hypothetical protein